MGAGSLNFPTGRGSCGCSKFHFFVAKFVQVENFSPKFCIFGRKFSDKKTVFMTG